MCININYIYIFTIVLYREQSNECIIFYGDTREREKGEIGVINTNKLRYDLPKENILLLLLCLL